MCESRRSHKYPNASSAWMFKAILYALLETKVADNPNRAKSCNQRRFVVAKKQIYRPSNYCCEGMKGRYKRKEDI